ncbi:hypothetical protein CTM_19734 [Clostridium tetanomorphum DSM 665]|nr:hypothetical protein [Clostridium tetanomorphum]KAJ50108.1 hypothetical protein CTM_19734 [Clostridium tetanomorphum DSM 665]NRZ99225.1 hypothetical protein [Clostridium tetanomorphum]SQC00206.1 histidine kinase [Clostridium tetanomorphum]
MLKISLIEFLFRIVPEGFLIILMAYVFDEKKVNKKIYIISSLLLAIGVYIIRLFPIHYGVHTILNIIIAILISSLANDISINKSIMAVLISTFTLSACEAVNVIVINKFLKLDMNTVLNNSVMKVGYGIISLILFSIVILCIHMIICKKKRGIKDVLD